MHIICAVDGSEFAEWGVQFLEALAARAPRTVTLLHVVDARLVRPSIGVRNAPATRLAAALDKAGNQILRRMAGTAKAALGQAVTKPHTKIRSVLARGSIATTIIREAHRSKADLVVLGSRGLSDVQGFLLGSVSRKVAALARCPVLVIKRPLTKLRHILLAVDGSRHSRAAAGFLRKAFLPESARVTILSVVEPLVTELAARYVPAGQLEELLKPKRDRAAQLTSQFRDWFLKEGYAVRAEVATDHVTDSILNYASRTHADLLVTGSRGLTGSERLALGSISEMLLKYSGCSVLIVRGWGA
jgi:nucleotide-binding universal stress UspA family protein